MKTADKKQITDADLNMVWNVIPKMNIVQLL